MAILVRPTQTGDATAIGRLAGEFAGYLRGLGDRTEFQLTAETYLRDGFGAEPAFRGLAAEESGEVIGYLLYHFGYDSDAAGRNLHIVDLYVDSRMRSRGAGGALMKMAARIAREAGAKELVWSVYNANGLATRFYEKIGARPITDVFFMKLRADAI